MLLLFFQFPDCTTDSAISVACLDLHYHVTVHANMQHKQEKKETHIPSTLGDDLKKGGDFTEQTDLEGGFSHTNVDYCCTAERKTPLFPIGQNGVHKKRKVVSN